MLNSKTHVVIANRGTLLDPRWVRTEVEEFRKHNTDRPLIGGTAAIIVVLAVHAKVLPVAFEGNSGAGLLLLAFAGGFSEQLIMCTLGKVANNK